jgi:hypothetical protein
VGPSRDPVDLVGGNVARRVFYLHVPALTDGRPRTLRFSSIMPWREVKRRLGGRTHRELLTIISGCYKKGEDVRKFLTFQVLETDGEVASVVDDLRRLMGQTFWAKAKGGRPLGPDLRAAKGLLSDIRGLTGDPQVLLDSMLDYVEHGIDFTREYGDMWEGYYSSIEGVFDDAAKHLLANPDPVDVAAAVARIEAMVGRTEWMGWGFNDYLEDRTEDLLEELRSRELV